MRRGSSVRRSKGVRRSRRGSRSRSVRRSKSVSRSRRIRRSRTSGCTSRSTSHRTTPTRPSTTKTTLHNCSGPTRGRYVRLQQLARPPPFAHRVRVERGRVGRHNRHDRVQAERRLVQVAQTG